MVNDDRTALIDKVKALWAKADDPAATEAERDAFRNKAAAMMAKYEINQFVLDVGDGTKEPPIVFGQFRINDYNEFLVPDERMLLAGAIARNFECRGIIHEIPYPTVDANTGEPKLAGVYFECIGYKHDFEMVQALYYSLVVDMIAGLFSEKQTHKMYQREYAKGFVDRMDQRLVEFYRRVNDWVDQGEVSDSVALAIRSRLAKVQDKFNEMYPETVPVKIKATKYDPNARARGKARADAADIGGAKLGGSRASGEIGAERRQLKS